MNIEIVLLKADKVYRTQICRDIHSTLEKLWNVIHRDIEKQAHHIQVLLNNELDQYKGKDVKIVDKNIKNITGNFRKHIKIPYNQWF